ncbi:hypothetical protein DICVIV_08886 [Dictyocaulus viviparus]|uniref:Glycosyltransferase family 61 protein n=1 Tax=Dictyocaulus viviparus TaxID=29172 RepID=A0A0D8XMP0_DICVI|nr:hypothetical protein DICVIV_08886 [Dictyocaulus viviparus]
MSLLDCFINHSLSDIANGLLKALEDIPNIIVKVVDYNGHVPFLSQLTSTYNSDVFIGMHGAGLTHLLFLPDWAAIMELHVPFLSQLTSTYNSDVFIGMHGAGLTHLLFLPDWAAIMELYNCGDQHCYRDLARLRGVKYFTWNPDKEHLIYPESTAPKSGSRESHRKFMNYRFDPLEFRHRVELMVEFVRRHPKFVEERRRLRRVLKSEEL